MRRAAIVAPVRSAVGVYGGSLRPVPVEKLIASVIKALIERSGLDPARRDDAERLKRRKGRYALETMCVGSGQGVAVIFEGA